MPLCSELKVVRSTHPTNLPFPDACFDAVMSCGVLEHVDECSGTPGNESKSLDEIARVLSPNGKFLIYQLPQKAAWQEAVVRRFKLGYAHPRRYAEAEIVAILAGAGFTVTRLKRANLVPKNLTGMPMALRKVYSKFTPLLLVLDRILCAIPILNRIAGVFDRCRQKQGRITTRPLARHPSGRACGVHAERRACVYSPSRLFTGTRSASRSEPAAAFRRRPLMTTSYRARDRSVRVWYSWRWAFSTSILMRTPTW